MDLDFLGTRLSQLREQKGLSARNLSLSIGHSAGYINKIENKKAFPSMDTFLYICDFLEVSPKTFFDDTITHCKSYDKLIDLLKTLNNDDLTALCHLAENLNSNK